MADIAAQRSAIEARRTQLAFVHMGNEQQAAAMFAKYDLATLSRFSDPQQKLYRAFGLKRGNLRQLFGLRVWKRGMEAMHHGIGMLVGDGFQMPGVFLLHQGKVLQAFQHETAADRPDYEALAEGRIYD